MHISFRTELDFGAASCYLLKKWVVTRCDTNAVEVDVGILWLCVDGASENRRGARFSVGTGIYLGTKQKGMK